jgi:predicted AlkP superfamily phosphohydrolase/phosphomutase
MLAALALLAVGLGVWNCAGAGEKPRDKVLLIGVDAGEWDVLGPLLDQQRLPAFGDMRAHGASGRLRSLEPLTKSPIIWASIATGKVPEKHGISDFFVKRNEKARAAAKKDREEGEAPSTSNLWRARPVWDIVGSLGRKVAVVGWWTTWPAQPVNGSMISDYAQYDDGSWAARDSKRTYPASLDSLAHALRRSPESVSWAELFQFVAPIDTTKVTARQESLLRDLRWIYAADMTFYRIALHLYKTDHPDFMSVYFRGVDAVSHRYWDIDIPATYNPALTDAEFRWLRTLIPNYYVFTDRMIGDFMNVADSRTNVVVCSDHGFMGGGKGVMAHKLDGMIFMKGPAVKKGVSISGATVLDITPTVLTLFGLPPARDMDGRAIVDALKSGAMRTSARDSRLKAFGAAGRKPGADGPLASPVGEGVRERLRSRGCME